MNKMTFFAALLMLAACGDDDATPPVDMGTGPSDLGGDAAVSDDAGVADDAAAGDDAGPVDVDAAIVPGAPTCTITAPVDGTEQSFDAAFTFVATATDPEDGALTGASVVWRSDLVVAPLGSGLSVMATLAPPGAHTITCTATDSDGNTGSDSIVVTSMSPVAVINHPADGETRPASVPFVGVARDLEDGALTGASLVWTSDVDGMLGTGGMLTRTLTAGTNVVTLTATDADGNTATDTVTLTITP